MVSRTCVLLLVAFFAYQGINGAHVEDARAVERGLVEDAQKLLNQLLEVIQTAIQTTVKKLTDLLNNLLKLATDLISGITSQLSPLVDGIIGNINKLVDKATALGLNTTECVGDKLVKITGIPIDVVQNVTACINPKLDGAKDIVGEAVGSVNDLVNIVAGLSEDLKKCGIGLGSLVCIPKVIASATFQIAQVPIKATGIVAKVVTLLTTITADVTACAGNRVADAVNEIGKVGGEVVSCLEDLITNAQP